MPKNDFYSLLGIFMERHFFDAEVCEKIRKEMLLSDGVPGRFIKKGIILMDENVRKTKEKIVSEETRTFIRKRLVDIKSKIEDHFNLELMGCQNPRFLFYKKGDFFNPHYDRGTRPENPQDSLERKISVVIFLNSEGEKPENDSYVGGSLKFYGLIEDTRFKNQGFHLIARLGSLVGFRSEILHEVTPVESGERYTIVSWFT